MIRSVGVDTGYIDIMWEVRSYRESVKEIGGEQEVQ